MDDQAFWETLIRPSRANTYYRLAVPALFLGKPVNGRRGKPGWSRTICYPYSFGWIGSIRGQCLHGVRCINIEIAYVSYGCKRIFLPLMKWTVLICRALSFGTLFGDSGLAHVPARLSLRKCSDLPVIDAWHVFHFPFLFQRMPLLITLPSELSY